jgi:peptidoglycan/xylan/chitin deacetylase (PgdA/CDA1 family)
MVVALAIDAGPGPGAARAVAAGHMTVSRTWHHGNLRSVPAVAMPDGISRAADAIHAATGERPGMFRGPLPGVAAGRVQPLCAGRAGHAVTTRKTTP